MYKLVDSASFFKEDSNVTILDMGGANSGLEKKAADERISEFVSRITPKPGKYYLHINAMGAGEYYGANRNCDYFPEEQLIRYHKTFETSPAHLFRHHINKDPKRANGVVIFSIYNERMHRVELVVEADAELIKDVEDRISRGDFPATSMACKTPYDVCSICGNKASSREEYCVHLARELGKIYPDGRKVMALNIGPLKFFDISLVIKPADVTSSVLQKVAGAGDDVLSSLQAAEEMGLDSGVEKFAELSKLSELIKEISDGNVVAGAVDPSKLVGLTNDVPYEAVEWLKEYRLVHTFKALADLGISPSISFLAELVARRSLGDAWAGVGPIAAEYLKEANPDTLIKSLSFEEEVESEVPSELLAGLSGYAPGSSLLPEYVEKRAAMIDLSRGEHFPEIDPNNPWRVPVEQEAKENVKAGYGKLLLSLAIAALIAKHFINKRIEKSSLARKNDAKIGVIKQASSLSDYALASWLSKAAMQQELSQVGQTSTSSVPLPNLAEKQYWYNKAFSTVAKRLKVGPELLVAMKLKRAANKLSESQ